MMWGGRGRARARLQQRGVHGGDVALLAVAAVVGEQAQALPRGHAAQVVAQRRQACLQQALRAARLVHLQGFVHWDSALARCPLPQHLTPCRTASYKICMVA